MAQDAPINALLEASPALLAIVPASRIRAGGYAGENPTAPYITHQTVSGTPQNYPGQRSGIKQFRVQVDVWANTRPQALQVAALIELALEEAGHMQTVYADEFDAEPKLWRYGFDWHLWVPR